MRQRLFVAAVLVLASGCDCSGVLHVAGGPCADPATRPAICGQSCDAAQPCAAGYYCTTAGACSADCVPSNPTNCPAPGICTVDGRCLQPDMDAGPLPDGTVLPDGDPNVCADVTVGATRVTPNVILVIDQSGSMTEAFGGSNRWDALRSSLMAQPAGFVFALQSSVRFGLALYSARGGSNGPAVGMCPLITWVDPTVDNFAAIDAIYGPADPIEETPTGDSLDAVLMRLQATPDPSPDPTIFILATDGEPDTCEQANPQNGQAESIAATQRAFDAGIRTFVISVGNDVGRPHLEDVANTGRGMPLGTACAEGSCYWVAGDDAGLRSALQTIIGGVLSCDLTLNGSIQDVSQACVGTVRITANGTTTTLPCDDPNGWRAVDPTHIQLQGTACDTLLHSPGVTLQATFPCDIILI